MQFPVNCVCVCKQFTASVDLAVAGLCSLAVRLTMIALRHKHYTVSIVS